MTTPETVEDQPQLRRVMGPGLLLLFVVGAFPLGARTYSAVTPSLARNPVSVPVSVGSASPYILLLASGVTDALFLVMLNCAVLYVIA